MAASKESLEEMYLRQGLSIPDIASATGMTKSTARKRLIDFGVPLRSRADGVRNAATKNKLGSGNRGKRLNFTEQWRKNISAGKLRSPHSLNAVGTTIKPSGYVEYTTGAHKGRLAHVVRMEEFIGRSLLPGEVVHHKDENKQNNDISNLELMTRSEHTKLHRKGRTQ